VLQVGLRFFKLRTVRPLFSFWVEGCILSSEPPPL